MRRTLYVAVTLSAAVATMLAATASLPGGAVAAAAVLTQPDGLDGILGFQVGEERRYIVGPREALRDGESATWSVRLERIESQADRQVGVFAMAHKESRWGITPVGAIMVHWNYDGELRINQDGFPEAVSFSVYEEHTGEAPWRGEIMSASYALADGEYHKTVRVPDQQWEFGVPIASHGPLDLDVPTGMFVFHPQSAAVDYFTNPALLGFALPASMPAGWKQRTMFFNPEGPVRYPDEGWVRSERDRQLSLGRYYDKVTLEAGAETNLEIGDRTVTVRRLRISGALRDAYVDEAGRVVRIDLDPDPWTRRDRYVRLLYPSEY